MIILSFSTGKADLSCVLNLFYIHCSRFTAHVNLSHCAGNSLVMEIVFISVGMEINQSFSNHCTCLNKKQGFKRVFFSFFRGGKTQLLLRVGQHICDKYTAIFASTLPSTTRKLPIAP